LFGPPSTRWRIQRVLDPPDKPGDDSWHIGMAPMTRPLIGITGFKKSGKTTLVEGLVRIFTARGLKVSTVKHAHHSFDIDHEGRDSHRHRMAGATEVAVVSGRMWAIMHVLEDEPEPMLDGILARMSPSDLVIIEGYKRDRHPKIEVRDPALGHPELAASDPTVIAIAAAQPLVGERVPVFHRDEVEEIANFIAAYLGLARATAPKAKSA
jgi:molybdopterin-guanine dinucleotide biosynthesis protein B